MGREKETEIFDDECLNSSDIFIFRKPESHVLQDQQASGSTGTWWTLNFFELSKGRWVEERSTRPSLVVVLSGHSSPSPSLSEFPFFLVL